VLAIVILDLRMPLMDGLGLLERWRADERLHDMTVVIVTGDYLIDDDANTKTFTFAAPGARPSKLYWPPSSVLTRGDAPVGTY